MATASGQKSTSPLAVSSGDLESEIPSLKAAFPNRCRVISASGEFSSVITIQPENLDATIKFQLPATYPSTIPDISVRSESLSEENLVDIKQLLKLKAKELVGQQMISKLVSEAEVNLRGMGLKPGSISRVGGQGVESKGQRSKKRQKNRQKKEEEEPKEQKLPPMKTADDVVKRIIWDEALEKDDFVVGYIDRFRGLLEKSFSDFSWEDLASVDYDVLAVPKHRIQYFKYKDVKVWDKSRRIDNVFGSADGTKTIDVVIKEVQEREGLELNSSSRPSVDRDNDNRSFSSGDDDIDEDDDDDDDDDDNIEVVLSHTEPVNNKKQAEENQHNHHHSQRLRPNHFLCLRITDPDIIKTVVAIQDEIIECDPLLGECCCPGAALHVTLCTLGLDTPEQVKHCVEVLKQLQPKLAEASASLRLKVSGVSDFYNHVVFAKIKQDPKFLELGSLVRKSLPEAGVEIRDEFVFVPHVTILKVSRPIARLRGTRNVPLDLYRKHLYADFGEQEVKRICLCAIGEERRDDGFYNTLFEMDLNV